MEQVEVEITVLAITAAYGALPAGAILRTNPEYAAHLVNEACCARYTAAPVQAAASPAAVVAAAVADAQVTARVNRRARRTAAAVGSDGAAVVLPAGTPDPLAPDPLASGGVGDATALLPAGGLDPLAVGNSEFAEPAAGTDAGGDAAADVASDAQPAADNQTSSASTEASA